nr:tetratricopeptide repeat protein [Candidatus Goldiibacteriota bacterium]
GLYYSLPVITLLWSNVDVCSIISIFILLIYIGYRLLETIEEPAKKEVYDFKLFLIVFLLTLAAVFINPSLHKNSWFFINEMFSNKWFTGYSFDLRGIKEMAPLYLYVLILILVMFYDVKGADVGRHGEFVKDVVLLIVPGILAAKHVKFIPIFLLISIPIFSYYVYLIFKWDVVWLHKWTEADLLRVKNPIYVFLLIILVLFSFDRLNKPKGQNYPMGAINYVSSVEVPKNVFVPSHWSGFFEYFLYPEYKIMLDTVRKHKQTTENDYLDIYNCNKDNPVVAEKYGINSFLLDYDAPVVNCLKQDGRYAVAYFDDVSVLFVNNEKTSRFFKAIKPFDEKFYDEKKIREAVAELENFSEEHPSEKSILLLAKLYSAVDKNKAIDYLVYVIEQYPGYYLLQNYLAKIYYEVGDFENAKEILTRSKKTGPEEAAILKDIKLKTGQTKL